jgi:hypothetical protein
MKKTKKINLPDLLSQILIFPFFATLNIAGAAMFGLVYGLFVMARKRQEAYEGYRLALLTSLGYEMEKPF